MGHAPRLEIGLLGPLEVAVDGGAVPVRGARQRALVAALALHAPDTVPADRLIDMVWGDDPPAGATNALQAQVSQLRRALGPAASAVVTRGSGYALDAERAAVDLDRFERLARDGRAALARARPADAVRALDEALALWRGQALVDLPDDATVRATAARAEEGRLAAVEARFEAELALGHHHEVVGPLEMACREHPLRETLWGYLVLALYRSGRQADALRAYAEARHHLVEELGIEPGHELRALEARVLAQDQALDLAPGGVRTRTERGAIRRRLTTFVGRAAEMDDLRAALSAARLVTIVGTGGAGKTRLAMELADAVAPQFADGAWVVELAAVTDPAAVPAAFATALRVADAASVRTGHTESVVDDIVAALVDREMLVVVDNCEHVVIDAAAVVEEILSHVDGVTVLATSREALGVPGEVIRGIRPLSADDAVALFVDRARAVTTSLPENDGLVREVCHRLDGLPLAIELAAARLRSLPLHLVAGRLDDRFRLLTGGARTALPRQQTLRAVVDWSYDLLFEDERELFARLAAFPAGATLDAIEAVCCDATLPAEDAGDLVLRLVDKSLVVAGEATAGDVRYGQLQTLWQYARERLAESGDSVAVRDRHLAWYVEMAERVEHGLRGPDGLAHRAQLDEEVDNLRAALEWAVERDDARSALALTVGVAWYWFLRGDWHKGIRWLGEAIDLSGDSDDVALLRDRARAWRAYFAVIVHGEREHLAASRSAFDSLSTHPDAYVRQEAALLTASTLSRCGYLDEALAVIDAARAAAAERDDAWGAAMADLLACNVHARQGDDAAAEAAARSSIEGFERAGECWATVEPLGTLASVHAIRGDLPAAVAAYGRAVAFARERDLPGYLAAWLAWLGSARACTGDDDGAARDFDEALAVTRNPLIAGVALVGLARVAARRGDRDGAGPLLDRAIAHFDHVGRTDWKASALAAAALTTVEAGDVERAERLADEADALRPGAALLARAAVAAAAGRLADARELLGAHEGAAVATVGSVTSHEPPDAARLRAAVSA